MYTGVGWVSNCEKCEFEISFDDNGNFESYSINYLEIGSLLPEFRIECDRENIIIDELDKPGIITIPGFLERPSKAAIKRILKLKAFQ